MLERRGVISGYEGSKPRQVLITEADLPRVLVALEASPTESATAVSGTLLAEMPEIGATLREARMRARIDVSEIEAKTKIRAKYLRALENEEPTASAEIVAAWRCMGSRGARANSTGSPARTRARSPTTAGRRSSSPVRSGRPAISSRRSAR